MSQTNARRIEMGILLYIAVLGKVIPLFMSTEGGIGDDFSDDSSLNSTLQGSNKSFIRPFPPR